MASLLAIIILYIKSGNFLYFAKICDGMSLIIVQVISRYSASIQGGIKASLTILIAEIFMCTK